MRILVTGGFGFIGSHLVEFFHQSHHVRVLDNLRTGSLHNLEGINFEWIEGSICDTQALKEAMKGVDLVFHMAAFVSVPQSMFEPDICSEINTKGTLNVLNAAKEAGVKKLVFASTAAVFGDAGLSALKEDMRLNPRSPYAVSKLGGEFHCEIWRREGWLNTVCCRFFNVFGERQNPSSQYGAVIPSFMKAAMNHEPVVIHGDGQQTRDFVYVKDVVDVMARFGLSPDYHGVYNVGYGKGISILSLADRIREMLGSPSEIIHTDSRPGDIKHSVASNDRLLSTGWTPTFGFDEGLNRMLEAITQPNG
ncbi:NAD-dependent epimerase/dehydratase family protein [Kiritimatiellaeota bacterium B1221]|nr:NAD-dependent epimerase/dehydratase family protein [Kiritimatiellaeota bacterium B1221]